MPGARWDIESATHPTANGGLSSTRFGGFLSGVEFFDTEAFRVSEAEAVLMDPQQRLLLEHTTLAMAASGRGASAFGGAVTTGIYIGCMWPREYLDLQMDLGMSTGAYSATGNGASFLAGRVPFTLGLTGPRCGPGPFFQLRGLFASPAAFTRFRHVCSERF